MSSLQPKRLSARDLEILHKHVVGMAGKDIAVEVGVTEQTVSNTINSDWARNEIALLHARTMEKIASGSYSPLVLARAVAPEAMAIQIGLMRSPYTRPQVRAKIADSILDRAGYKPATRLEHVDVDEIFDKMTAEELDDYAANSRLPERFIGTQAARYLGTGAIETSCTEFVDSPPSQPGNDGEADATEITVE